MILSITTPIPSSELAPNKSKGRSWRSTIDYRNQAKKIGFYLAKEGMQRLTPILLPKKAILRCDMRVFFKNGVHLDDDNLIGAFKPCQDGIFKALKTRYPGINDNQIKLRILDTRQYDEKNPRIEYYLTIAA